MNGTERLGNVTTLYGGRTLPPTNARGASVVTGDSDPFVEDETLHRRNPADESLSITDVLSSDKNLLDEEFPTNESFGDSGTERGYILRGLRTPRDENSKPSTTPACSPSGSSFSLSEMRLDYTPLRNATFEELWGPLHFHAPSSGHNDEDSS